MSNLSIDINRSYQMLGTQCEANESRAALTHTVARISAGFLLMTSIVFASFAQTDVQSQEEPAKGWELEVAEPPKLEIDPNYEVASESLFDAPVSESVDPTAHAVKNELRVVEGDIAKQAVVLSINPQLRDDLDAQFQRIQSSLETEDAFSEALGEEYLSYGLLLIQAGRYDDAREVLTDAVHISKINNGLNSIEQRPYLSALFDVHMLQANAEGADKAIQKIIWLERENRGSADDTTYEMALRLGNRYLDQFLHRPVVGQESFERLARADKYFNHVLRKFGRGSERKLPYGELALVNFWRAKIAVAGVKAQANVSPFDRNRQFRSANNDLPSFRGRRTLGVAPAGETYITRAEFYLKRYLARVRLNGTPQMEVKAILSLGDINLMLRRKPFAEQYYALAWTEAQKLAPDDPLLKSFEHPVALPDFDYAIERTPVVKGEQALMVSLNFGVDEFGRVNSVQPLAQRNKNYPYFGKARRAIKRIIYRPAIREGKLVATNNFTDDVLVQIKELVQAPALPELVVPDEALLESDSQGSEELENAAQESSPKT